MRRAPLVTVTKMPVAYRQLTAVIPAAHGRSPFAEPLANDTLPSSGGAWGVHDDGNPDQAHTGTNEVIAIRPEAVGEP